MGHVRLGTLPRTRKWRQVISLIEAGARARQVANTTLAAADRGLLASSDDPAFVETVWLLTQLPVDARSKDFAAALRRTGLDVSDTPSLLDIVSAATECIDRRVEKQAHRTDLGEMAQNAAAETLNKVIGERTRGGLFGTAPEDVQKEFARLGTNKQFGIFAREFFARLTDKCLNYYVSRVLNQNVGESRRFSNLAQQAEFSDALAHHCRQASKIIEAFAGGWFSKTNWEKNGISKQDAAGFAHVAMRKIRDELREGARPNAE